MKQENFERKSYKYIYNITWANYLMLHGAVCKGTGRNQKTGGIYWVFDYRQVQPIYEEYNQLKKEK